MMLHRRTVALSTYCGIAIVVSWIAVQIPGVPRRHSDPPQAMAAPRSRTGWQTEPRQRGGQQHGEARQPADRGDPQRRPQPEYRAEESAGQRAERPGAVVDRLERAAHPGLELVRYYRGEDRAEADVQ